MKLASIKNPTESHLLRLFAALLCGLLASLGILLLPLTGMPGEFTQSFVAVASCALLLYLWAIRPMLREHLKALERVESSAIKDDLTGLLNRRTLNEQLTRLIASSSRARDIGALLYFDLDGFKAINDEYGHKTGDIVLEAIGRRLLEATRKDDTAFRIGGDEFILLVQHLGDDVDEARERCEALAYKLSSHITDSIPSGQHKLSITASVGTTLIGDHLATPDMLMHSADTAMYEAKRCGKNRVVSAHSLGLSWHRIAEIGCPEIDSDHAHLEALLIDAIDDQKDPIGKTRKLISETRQHFLREENYAANHGLNMTEGHTREHRRLSKLFQELGDELTVDNLSDTQLAVLGATREHIRDYDTELLATPGD